MGPESCVRPALSLRAALPLGTNCGGLSISDKLGAFRWRCVPGEGGSVLVEAVSLLPGQGLTTLLDEQGWKHNALELRNKADGRLLLWSDEAAWFDTRVLPAPPNGGTGALRLEHPVADGRGSIFVVSADRASSGYEIAADGIGLVVLEGRRHRRR